MSQKELTISPLTTTHSSDFECEVMLDRLGYLKHSQDWTEQWANKIAFQEDIQLTACHWTVIVTLREFYLVHGVLPPMRGLLKLLSNKIPCEQNNSLYLQSIFPKGLMRQASKIAGLPKPVRCI